MITAKDICKRDGYENASDRINKMAATRRIKILDGYSDNPIYARLDFSRWIAVCECGGAEYVDKDDPVFFCFSCNNCDDKNHIRSVIFPDNIKSIETEVEKREVTKGRTDDIITAAFREVPKIIGLSRSWSPGESITDLKNQLIEVKSGNNRSTGR